MRFHHDAAQAEENTARRGAWIEVAAQGIERTLREEGRTVILVSHNMADVVALADRVAILRNGVKVLEREVAGLDADRLAHMVMTGRDENPAA